MKKVSFLFLSALTLLLAACAEATYEWHNTHFEPQKPGGMMFYADQEYDSIKVFSYDPWSVLTEGDSAWFTCSPTSGDARPGSPALTRIDVNMPQNTSGRNRRNAIVVKSYFDIRMPVFQTSWLNITRPTPDIRNKENFLEQNVYFEMKVDEKAYTESINFHVYQDNAKLTIEKGWVSFTGDNADKYELTFNKGTHNVPIKISRNEYTNDRLSLMTLQSGNVTNSITIKQLGKKDDKEEK